MAKKTIQPAESEPVQDNLWICAQLDAIVETLRAFVENDGRSMETAGGQTETERRKRIYLYTPDNLRAHYVDVTLVRNEEGYSGVPYVAIYFEDSEPSRSLHTEFEARIVDHLKSVHGYLC